MYVSVCVSVCNLWSGLFPFSELVCDVLPRRLFDGFSKGALPEEYFKVTILTNTAWEDTRLIWCLSYHSGGASLIPGRYVSW